MFLAAEPSPAPRSSSPSQGIVAAFRVRLSPQLTQSPDTLTNIPRGSSAR